MLFHVTSDDEQNEGSQTCANPLGHLLIFRKTSGFLLSVCVSNVYIRGSEANLLYKYKILLPEFLINEHTLALH